MDMDIKTMYSRRDAIKVGLSGLGGLSLASFAGCDATQPVVTQGQESSARPYLNANVFLGHCNTR